MEKLKKSELYKYAQGAVVECDQLAVPTKLEILRELMHMEDIALYTEKQEEKEKGEVY